MKLFVPVVLASIAATVYADGCQQVAGNYYCSQTSKVIYENIGFSGSYQDVTNMDETTGQCTQQSHSFSGNLSPFDEELSVHFRGPLKLLQFGVYYPSSSSNSKRQEDEDCVQHVHHKHKRATAVAVETQTVFVNGDGQETTSPGAPPAPSATGAPAGDGDGVAKALVPTTYSVLPSSTASSLSSNPSAAAGSWERASYYTPGNADNLVFQNYFGGSGSGVWSSAFGNSLSYANSDASGGSANPVALEETTIGNDKEYCIFSGDKCSGNDCGYYRSGTPAHHGFGGSEKIFVFEFEMPSGGSGSGFNYDMPAVWLLNAKIPRTLQYGDSSCSCWSTGCGELDLFEILSAGSNNLISHMHDGQGTNNAYGGGGSQDYFSRPTSGSLKAAVVFTGNQIHILEVTDDFGSTLSADTVSGWVSQKGSIASIGY